jgi:hypothetical protein
LPAGSFLFRFFEIGLNPLILTEFVLFAMESQNLLCLRCGRFSTSKLENFPRIAKLGIPMNYVALSELGCRQTNVHVYSSAYRMDIVKFRKKMQWIQDGYKKLRIFSNAPRS